MAKYKSRRYHGKRIRVHRVILMVWCQEQKALAKIGFENLVIHHRDGDGTNNDPKNLAVMTAREHNQLHARAQKRDKKGRFK